MTEIFRMTDDQFNDYCLIAQPYLVANGVRLTVSTLNMTALAGGMTAWNNNWQLYKNADTRTATVISIKQFQRANLESVFTNIYNDIPRSLITPPDTTTLGIKATHAPATPTPVMSVSPMVTRRVKTVGLSEFRFTDPSAVDSKALPRGQAFVFIKVFAGDPVAPGNPVPYNIYYHASHTHFDIAFDPTLFGKTAYVQCQYVNNRGLPGPVSSTVEFIIA